MLWHRILFSLLFSHNYVNFYDSGEGKRSWCYSSQGKHAHIVRLGMLQHLGSESHLLPRFKLGFCSHSVASPASPLQQEPFLLQPADCCWQCQTSGHRASCMWELALLAAWQNVGKLLVTITPSAVQLAAQVPHHVATLASRRLRGAYLLILLLSCLQVKTSGTLC